MPGEKPNILILMPDQMRADCMSCAGHPQIRTPNMDRLARDGVLFPEMTASVPLTLPSHRTIESSTLRTICTQAGISRQDFLDTYRKK